VIVYATPLGVRNYSHLIMKLSSKQICYLGNLVENETVEYIAIELTPTLNFREMTESGFIFFRHYFRFVLFFLLNITKCYRWVNSYHRKLFLKHINGRIEESVLKFNLLNIDYVWEIAFVARDNRVCFLTFLHCFNFVIRLPTSPYLKL